MDIKVRRNSSKVALPTLASPGAACFDICTSNGDAVRVFPGIPQVFPTGLFFEIPEGFALMVYSRSGHGFNNGVRLANCVGVLDSDYRGELMVKLTADQDPYTVRPGERIAQAMVIPVPTVSFIEADQLSETVRGASGFGSTGKH